MLPRAILYAVNSLFNIINFMILIRVFSSWLPFLYENRFAAGILNTIYTLTEPIMQPARKLLSRTSLGNMPVDFSPIIVILVIDLVQQAVVLLLGSLLL